MRSDHRHLTAYQIGCEVGQYIVLVLRPAILDHDILALDVAGFANALPECGQIACTISKRRAAEESNHRHRRLLRPRRKRPCRRAADQRDELAAPHSITSSARSRNDSGMASSSALAVVRLITRSNLLGCSTGMSPGFAPRRTLSTKSAERRNSSTALEP